ncbi:hypothetical protein DPMN_036085 [Dreissena polymorpha]|uniref:Paraneoplastic antigen Ma-like C-terminal domain-containing protein n=1 Tax=Dreissena polymorpha TaxID=45954 RepID=A0A9D4MCA8_DREPO|nr:hypothetical protein DPMN_036085 [Dreissena polymorpha]
MADKKGSDGSGADADTSLSEAQLKQILEAPKKSGDYVVLTKEKHASLQKPSFTTSTPGFGTHGHAGPRKPLTEFIRGISSPSHSFNNSQKGSHLQVPRYETPKLPYFSGEQQPMKGDETYDVWRFETKCLISENLPEHVVLQVIYKSLRGTARRALISLGEHATSQQILDKLKILFGKVLTYESVMQTFYNASQKVSENVTAYGCWL